MISASLLVAWGLRNCLKKDVTKKRIWETIVMVTWSSTVYCCFAVKAEQRLHTSAIKRFLWTDTQLTLYASTESPSAHITSPAFYVAESMWHFPPRPNWKGIMLKTLKLILWNVRENPNRMRPFMSTRKAAWDFAYLISQRSRILLDNVSRQHRGRRTIPRKDSSVSATENGSWRMVRWVGFFPGIFHGMMWTMINKDCEPFLAGISCQAQPISHTFSGIETHIASGRNQASGNPAYPSLPVTRAAVIYFSWCTMQQNSRNISNYNPQ